MIHVRFQSPDDQLFSTMHDLFTNNPPALTVVSDKDAPINVFTEFKDKVNGIISLSGGRVNVIFEGLEVANVMHVWYKTKIHESYTQ